MIISIRAAATIKTTAFKNYVNVFSKQNKKKSKKKTVQY